MSLSFFTIVGWAWVGAAFMRWMCRKVEGTNSRILFTGTGWEYLWRTVVFGLSAAVIIPIPWTYHWYVRWFLSRLQMENREHCEQSTERYGVPPPVSGSVGQEKNL